ncbi:MAG: HD domain-containing protein [Patescibacteria group bacterium]
MNQQIKTTIRIPKKENHILNQTINKINQDKEVQTLWRVANINAIERLNMTDHGPIHFQIVANIGLKLFQLISQVVKPTITKNYPETNLNHAETVVFLGCILHDLGMSINREGHEMLSLFLADRILQRTLEFIPVEERTIIIAETLHAIFSHRNGGTPLTIEAGIVRVADALDMSKGRSRISFSKGDLSIHSVSAMAINSVELRKGTIKPVIVKINMNNSSGLFQIDNLLKPKLKNSGLEKFIEVEAKMTGNSEHRLVKDFNLKL